MRGSWGSKMGPCLAEIGYQGLPSHHSVPSLPSLLTSCLSPGNCPKPNLPASPSVTFRVPALKVGSEVPVYQATEFGIQLIFRAGTSPLSSLPPTNTVCLPSFLLPILAPTPALILRPSYIQLLCWTLLPPRQWKLTYPLSTFISCLLILCLLSSSVYVYNRFCIIIIHVCFDTLDPNCVKGAQCIFG